MYSTNHLSECKTFREIAVCLTNQSLKYKWLHTVPSGDTEVGYVCKQRHRGNSHRFQGCPRLIVVNFILIII